MSMKYVAAYLLSYLGGNEHPSKDNVEKILNSIGASIDDNVLNHLLLSMKDKNIDEVVNGGLTKLQAVSSVGVSGSGGQVASNDSSGAAATDKKDDKKKVEEEEEEEDDEDCMGFSLFD